MLEEHSLFVAPPQPRLAPAANRFREMSAAGYKVVPIIPGEKTPGQRVGLSQWTPLSGWATYPATDEDFDRWHRDGAGVGIVAGDDLLILDIDIMDEALADEAERDATEMLGLAPCRIGQPPKRALVYRISAPFNKTNAGDPSKGAGIEFRTKAHQTVAYGFHPTGRPYEWPRPLVPVNELPLAEIENIRAFKEKWDTKLGTGGNDLVTRIGCRAVDQENLKGPLDLLTAAIAAIPNDARPEFDRDYWITACHALAAASADYPDEGFDLWMSFCERHPTFNEAKSIHAWETIGTEHRIGIDWLYRQALKYSDAFGSTHGARYIEHKDWFAENMGLDAPPVSSDAPPKSLGLFLFQEDEDDEDRIEPQDPFGYGDMASALDIEDGVLPDLIDAFASDQSRRVGMPKAYVALSGLVTFAGAVGNKVRIQPKANDTEWTEPAILWGLLVGGVGSKKTPAMRVAVDPLVKVDSERASEGYRRYAEWERQKKAAKSQESKAALPPEPTVERNLAVNATTEALAAILGDSPAGVLLYQDELAAWLGSMDAYKASKGGDRGLMLQFFNGGAMSIDRIGRRQKPVKFFGGSILGGIQPDKIRRMADNLDDDGLLQRFLVVYAGNHFDAEIDQDVDEAPDLAAKAGYTTVVTKWALAPSDAKMVVRLSEQAQEVWRPLAGRIRALEHLPGLSDAWLGHLAKWPGISARILLLCHLLDNAAVETHEIDSVLVSATTARRAVRLCEWLLVNSMRFYSECIGGGETVNDARWIAGHILTKPNKLRFSRNDLGDARHEMRGQDDRIQSAMSLLTYMGWVVPNNETRLDIRRRPTQWTICPAVHDGRFADIAKIEKRQRKEKQASIRAAGAVRAQLMGESSVFD